MSTKEEQDILARAEEIKRKLHQIQIEEKKQERKRRKIQHDQEVKERRILDEENRKKQKILLEEKTKVFEEKLPEYLGSVKTFDDEIKKLEIQSAELKHKT